MYFTMLVLHCSHRRCQYLSEKMNMNTEKLKQYSERSAIDGESLTKLALNNKIVEMRKNVRQSRVQCINKLIKEIRRLKSKKGTEEQVGKNLKKVDRLTEQMAVMKKVNPDAVSKFALQNEKSLEEVTNDVNETVENKALARLACHKSVNQKVLEFREKFPEWKKSLSLFLESLGEKYKNKKQTAVVSRKKEKKSISRRNDKNSVDKEDLKVPNPRRAASIRSSSGFWTVSTCESEDVDDAGGESKNTNDTQSTALANISNSNEFCDEDSDFRGKPVKVCVDVQKTKSKTKNSQVPVKNVKTESSIEIVSKKNITNTLSNFAPDEISDVSTSKPESKEFQVSYGNAETKSFIESIGKEFLKTESASAAFESVKNDERPGNMSNSNVPEIAADPFFMTKDNKEYLSISARPRDDTEESAINYKERRKMKPQSKFERFHTKPNQFKTKSNQNNSFGKRKNFDSIRGKPGDAKDTSATPSLHPSWVAKKKQSTIIQNSQFQGKKIKFDD